MPPRVVISRLSQPTQCQCLRGPTALKSRAFHASAKRTARKKAPSRNKREQTLSEEEQIALIKATRHRPMSLRTANTPEKREMALWLIGEGSKFRDPLPGSTNYLSAWDNGELIRTRWRPDTDANEEEVQLQPNGLPKERLADLRPYPMNNYFRSENVLSEEFRDFLYDMVAVQGHEIEDMATQYNVDMRRVAAVVRLKTVEQQWLKEGKKLAKPYARAVMDMLPQTHLRAGGAYHEGINDLPVHPKTRQQIFYPASESRHFTREDAAKAFAGDLLTADKRIPLPQLVKAQKMRNLGMDRDERIKVIGEDNERDAALKASREAKQKEWEERTQRIVSTRRWDFKFQDIGAQRVSPEGKSQTAVGARYGWPHEDRKRGMTKIPTSVE